MIIIYLGCESAWRKVGSGSELRGDAGPVSGPVPENSSTEEELLPWSPSHHHLRPHPPYTWTLPIINKNTTVLILRARLTLATTPLVETQKN